eukprot:COSAG01_NODE_33291_length_566_cov_5.147752_1_plen_98_part_01
MGAGFWDCGGTVDLCRDLDWEKNLTLATPEELISLVIRSSAVDAAAAAAGWLLLPGPQPPAAAAAAGDDDVRTPHRYPEVPAILARTPRQSGSSSSSR